MNHRETALPPATSRRSLRCLAALLLPAIGPGAASAPPRTGRADSLSVAELRRLQLPYLPVCGAPPLRFARPAPPPDLAAEPPAAAPPVPDLSPTENLVASANTAAMQPVEPSAPPAAASEAPASPMGAPPRTPPPAILPDDTRPSVRAEDFLPFFRVPGGGRGAPETSVIVPGVPTAPSAPAVPPSAATYTQTPR